MLSILKFEASGSKQNVFLPIIAPYIANTPALAPTSKKPPSCVTISIKFRSSGSTYSCPKDCHKALQFGMKNLFFFPLTKLECTNIGFSYSKTES